MAGRFVRSSKYRQLDPQQARCIIAPNANDIPGHVFGKPTRKEFCYDNLRISRNAWDTNLVKVIAFFALIPSTLSSPISARRALRNFGLVLTVARPTP